MAIHVDISDEIRARYEADDRIPHPKEVAIQERDGTVTLRGTVGSPRQRHAAAEVAAGVPGVEQVIDEMTVDPLDRVRDEELRGVALQALVANEDVPADWVDVTVDAGWLTLKGQVKHMADSDAAFAAVADLPGVGGITNEIKVITAGGH